MSASERPRVSLSTSQPGNISVTTGMIHERISGRKRCLKGGLGSSKDIHQTVQSHTWAGLCFKDEGRLPKKQWAVQALPIAGLRGFEQQWEGHMRRGPWAEEPGASKGRTSRTL